MAGVSNFCLGKFEITPFLFERLHLKLMIPAVRPSSRIQHERYKLRVSMDKNPGALGPLGEVNHLQFKVKRDRLRHDLLWYNTPW